jgi:hypothetical protein
MPSRRRRWRSDDEPEQEQRRGGIIIRNAGRFASDRDARESIRLELPEPAPEPEDIDRVSREHDSRWADHFGRDEQDGGER